MENRITFKIKIGYYLKLLTPETMKLLVSTKSKKTKDENGEKSTLFRGYWGSISTFQFCQ